MSFTYAKYNGKISFIFKFATGSTLCQIQNDKPNLIAYVSKRLPEAAKSYSFRVGTVWIGY